MNYGRAIRLVRAARGQTAKDLAEQVGISAVHISQVERGVRSPSLKVLDSIARELGMSVPLLGLIAADPGELDAFDALGDDLRVGLRAFLFSVINRSGA